MVFVDHAAERFPVPHWRARRDGDWLVMAGWPLRAGLVRPMIVVVPGAGPQHHAEMALAVDQHPVRAFGYAMFPRPA